jgi:hypothetical protein
MHSVALDTLASAGVPTGEGLTIAKAIVYRRTARVYPFIFQSGYYMFLTGRMPRADSTQTYSTRSTVWYIYIVLSCMTPTLLTMVEHK